MASVPNQNDIVEIIKSNVKSMETVVETVLTSANKIAEVASASMSNVEIYSSTINALFDKGGLYNIIIETLAKFEGITKVKLNKRGLKHFRANVTIIFSEIKALSEELSGYSNIEFPELNFGGFNKIVESIQDLLELANDNNFLTLKIKFKRINKIMRNIVTGLNSLDVSLDSKRFEEASKGFDAAFKLISGALVMIEEAPILPLYKIKIKNIKKIVSEVILICEVISLIPQDTIKNAGINAKELSNIFDLLKNVFKAILKTGAGPLVRLNLKIIDGSIKRLSNILIALENLKVNKTTAAKLTSITLIVGSIALVFTTIALFTPIWLIGIIAVLVLFGVIKLFSFIMKFVISALVQLATGPALKGMLALLVISLLFTAIAAMFMFLGSIAEEIVKQSLWILAMLGVIIAFVGLMAVLGLACAAAAVPLLAAIVGIALTTIIAGLLVLLAIMLKEFEKINLDGKKIKENVNLVLSVAKDIINSIFVSDEKEDKESEKSWIEDILTYIGGAIGPVIKAIMAVAFLALMVVGICMILLIAGMLRLIQELDLDPNKIKQNVKAVLDTAQEIIDLIFKGEDQNAKATNKSWIESVIDYIGGGLVKVIKAIFAVAYLALMVVAILFITLIATELRLLQCLDLDPGKIKENVSLVIATAQMVVSAIFDPADKESEQSNKGWITTVISWFSPELATILEAIMAIAFLATMIVCILLINILALELKSLQEIMLDPALIEQNVNTVIDTCQLVVNSVMDRKDKDDDPSSKGWIRTLFEWIGMDGLLQIIDCIMALAWLGMSVALINMVTMLANQLKTLQDIKLDKNKITANTEAVCKTADAVSACVLGRKNPIKGSSDGPLGKVLRWLFPALAEAIDMMTKMKWVSGIMSTVGVVKQVADTLMQLLDLPDVAPVKNKVKYVCDTADSIVAMVTSRPGVDTWDDAKSRITWMERITRTVKEMGRINPTAINKSKKALAAHIALVKQINSVDVTKLETSAKMFEQMSRFSESVRGNFEKLAESLNEDLMPVLEELKEIMEKVPEKLDTGFQNTSASIAAQNAPVTREGILAQLFREKPDLSKPEAQKQADSRMAEKAKTDSTNVVAKLDELISLLKGQSGENIVVQTV